MFIFTLSAWQHNTAFDNVNVHCCCYYCCCCYHCLLLIVFFMFFKSCLFRDRYILFLLSYLFIIENLLHLFLVFTSSCLYIAINTVKLCVLNVYFAVCPIYVCVWLFPVSHSTSGFHVGQFELNRSTSPPGGNQVDGLPLALSNS